LAVTAPCDPFGKSTSVWVPAAPNDKPSGAIYSVSVSGGDLRVEAHGIRNPRGLAFNEYGRLYATNAGMEMRGTRPVRNDPDTVLRIVRGTWYGWPDFTADLQPVTQAQYQPPAELISRSGYPETSLLIDHQTSGLLRPDRQTLLQGVLPPQSGIGGMEFVPPMPQLQQYRGSAIITVWGEGGVRGQGAFAPGAPTARKVIRLDVDAQKAHDFIYNVHGDAATSQRWAETLQRPVDVKFAPDGALYILDSDAVDYRHGRLHKAIPYTGKIYRLDRTVTAK
jgi:glucose/arabinose dehydrogenase